MNLAQIVQSHALSFFHLSSPDLLLGFDHEPMNRNILGVAERAPELARDGIAVRKFGQEIIERLGGKRIHPAWVVPGGSAPPWSRGSEKPYWPPCLRLGPVRADARVVQGKPGLLGRRSLCFR